MKLICVRWLRFLIWFLPAHFVVTWAIATVRGQTDGFGQDVAAWVTFFAPGLIIIGLVMSPIIQWLVARSANLSRGFGWHFATVAVAYVLAMALLELVTFVGAGRSGLWITGSAATLPGTALGLGSFGYRDRAAASGPIAPGQTSLPKLIYVTYLLILGAAALYGRVAPMVAPSLAYSKLGPGPRATVLRATLPNVRPGMSAEELNGRLPGFVPEEALRGERITLSGADGTGFQYWIRFVDGMIDSMSVSP